MEQERSEPAIAVRGVHKQYGDVHAVVGVDFTVPWGQVCGYLGPNGAGKSTTIRMLAGILQPTSGSIAIAGHDLAAAPLEARRALGFVPDAGALYGLLSAREHVALIADLYELDPTRAHERAEELLSLFDASDLMDRRVDTLSKGQTQKVALTMGLLHEPRVLLLDEPLSGLDAASARVLKDLLRGFADRGNAVLYSSHILDVVERLCDRAVILHEGRIVADAPTGELVARGSDKTLESVFHALTRAEDVEGLADAFLDGKSKSKKKSKKKKKK